MCVHACSSLLHPVGRRPVTALILGIDPGKTGALALLDPDCAIVAIEDMPDATGAALGAQIAALLADWSPHTIAAAWVEFQTGRPGQSSSAMFTFATGYGAILGALGALHIPVHHVTPAHWKRTQRVTKDKASSRQRFAELWGAHAGMVKRVKDDGRAEAALIARHGLLHGEGA